MQHDTEARDLTQQALPDALTHAVTALCDLKLQMDRHARGFIGQPFLDDWMDARNTCAYFGDSLVRLVLPFLDWERDGGEYFKAYVNPRHVLGASIKGLPEHIEESEVPERIARYAQAFGSPSNAAYIWIKAMGIFWAHEGKHRVAFMRAHNQPAIAAWVREASYPAAERMVVIAPDDEQDEWLALLDGRYLQVLRRPGVSTLLLGAYGVKTLRWRALTGLPGEQSVRAEIGRRKLHRAPKNNAERERTLDLEEVRERLRADDERVARSVLELEPHRMEWRSYAAIAAVCGVLGLLLGTVGSPWLHGAGYLLMGTTLGLVLALHLMRFVGSKRPRDCRM